MVAIDTETTGLSLTRDRLCLVQISTGNGKCHLIQFKKSLDGAPYQSANQLRLLLKDSSITKLFHYGRFDLGMLAQWIGPVNGPVYCTKIASKLARTNTDRHGLKDLCHDLIGVELLKEHQSSDWGSEKLTEEQLQYAAGDVLYLHQLKTALDIMLEREGRKQLAESCFLALKTRVQLDLGGWLNEDIFSH